MTELGTVQRARGTMPLVRLAVLASGPLAIAFGSWVYLAVMIDDMSVLPGMKSLMMAPSMFDPAQVFGLFVMWAVMMAAMMLPTAAPMIVAYARMQGAHRLDHASFLPVAIFAIGYVIAWAGFSAGAAILQAGLTSVSVLSPMMMKTVSGPVAGGIIILAGIYQLTPLKGACLQQCRTPMSFLLTRWREGNWGALTMGWQHGLYCVGCCWALMGLLFVAGVMNTGWIIAIMLYVLAEKLIPNSVMLSRFTAAGLIGVGVWMMV